MVVERMVKDMIRAKERGKYVVGNIRNAGSVRGKHTRRKGRSSKIAGTCYRRGYK